MAGYEALAAEHGEHRLSITELGVFCDICGEFIIEAEDDEGTVPAEQLRGAGDDLAEVTRRFLHREAHSGEVLGAIRRWASAASPRKDQT